MVKNICIGIVTIAAVSSLLLAGCSGSSVSYESTLTDATSVDSSVQIIESTPTPEAESSVSSPTPMPIAAEEITPSVIEETLKTIGTEAEGDSVYRKKLTNNTGEAVTGFFVKDQWMEDWPVNMIDTGDSWADGEARYLYFDASDSLKRQSDYEERPVYSILLIFEGGNEAVLHDVALTDFEEAQVMTDSGTTYLAYRSLGTNEDVSTLAAEQERAERYTWEDEETEEDADEASYEEEETEEDANEEEYTEEDNTEEEYTEEDEWDDNEEGTVEVEG